VLQNKKNDRTDASKIADCLRCDFLPECQATRPALPEPGGQEDGADKEPGLGLVDGDGQ
jgi:hypothetical protein